MNEKLNFVLERAEDIVGKEKMLIKFSLFFNHDIFQKLFLQGLFNLCDRGLNKISEKNKLCL